MTRLAPRMRVNKKDDTVTITGIPYYDFKRLMTLAALGLYNSEDRVKKRGEPTPEDVKDFKRLHWIIKRLDSPPYSSGVETKPVIQLRKHEIPLRWRDVRDKKRSRIVIEEIMADIEAKISIRKWKKTE